MNALRLVLLSGLLLLAAQPQALAAERLGELSSPSALQAIESAYDAGEIGQAEALLYKLYALHQSARLPEKYRVAGAVPVKCGTQIVLEVQESLASMPGKIAQEAAALLARPTLDSYIDTTHFRVHYATTGTDMVSGWPDATYRDAVMDACETSWALFHTTNGWPAPPSDGAAGGGSALIDCYVDDLGTGAYGVTYSESIVAGGHPFDYTSYFVIDNDYVGFGYADNKLPMRVTVAHEYHHVIQMGLNAQGSGGWFMENTATFVEDEVYDSINDNYNYLSLMLANPWKELKTANGGFEYGAFIWPTYLTEGIGGHALVRDTWVEYADLTNLYTCFDNNLAPYGKNLDTAMAQWATWNLFTWLHDDGNHYVEGSDYHYYQAYDKNITTYPQTNVHPTSTKKPAGLGANITRFARQTGSTDNKITVTYQVLNACSYNHVISFMRKIASQSVWDVWDVPVDATGAASFEMTQWDQTEYMYMVVAMKRGCALAGTDFQFSASTTYTVDVADLAPTRALRLDQNSPNPFNPSTAIRFSLPEPGSVRLVVHDAAGREIRSLVDSVLPAGEQEVHWGGTDDAGRLVASGVYFCTLEANGGKTVRKMILSR